MARGCRLSYDEVLLVEAATLDPEKVVKGNLSPWFKAGSNGHEMGKTLNDCPYVRGHPKFRGKRLAWMCGWLHRSKRVLSA